MTDSSDGAGKGMHLEHLALPTVKKCSKKDGNVSQGNRKQFKWVPTGRTGKIRTSK